MVPPNLGPPKKYKVKIILFMIDDENIETHIDFAVNMHRHISISFIQNINISKIFKIAW